MHKLLAAVAAGLLVTACSGGGGGGVGPIPAPAPTPTPSPSNTSFEQLRANQAFATQAASATSGIDTAQGLVVDARTAPSTLQVRYDAATNSYTVEAPSRSQTFGAADIASNANGETVYSKTSGDIREYLTLVSIPYSANTPNQYVRLGYWQRNQVSPGRQDTSFDSFVYGFETNATAVPRTGTAGYVTDTLGFVTNPGKAPRAFTGPGTFSVDFGLGVFATQSSVQEYDLVSGASVSGGGIEFTGGGHLASGNGFSGNFTYSGWDGSASGTIAGRFFGPAAQELGASFSADNATGGAVTGSITGRSANVAPANLTLVNLTQDQLFYVHEAGFALSGGAADGTRGANTIYGIGQLTLDPQGGVRLTGASSEIPYVPLTAADRVAEGRPNYISYQKDGGGGTTRVSLYRVGSGNSELALTYSSMGSWSGGLPVAEARYYFSYGIVTPRSLLERRTGTAQYAGVAIGSGALRDGTTFGVSGTSQFNVDFTRQSFTGALMLSRDQTGGAAASLGTWTFGDRLSYALPITTPLLRDGTAEFMSRITPTFYGPDAEEIGASFLIQSGAAVGGIPGMTIAGATVAKRP